MKVTQLVVGGLGIDGPKDLLNRLALDLLGVKFKYVPAQLKPDRAARLAAQRDQHGIRIGADHKTAVAPLNFLAQSVLQRSGTIRPTTARRSSVTARKQVADLDPL